MHSDAKYGRPVIVVSESLQDSIGRLKVRESITISTGDIYMTTGLFNDKGEMNATSVSDAVSNLAKYASVIQNHMSSTQSLAGKPSYTEQQKDDMVKRALQTTEGKIALGQAMALPIRRNLDYQGVARRALVVDPLMVAA
jgi:hypothetical protein